MLLIGYNSKLSYLCLHFQCESAIDFFKTSKIGDRWCKLIKKLIRAVNKSILNSNSKWGLDLSKIIEHINTIKQSSNITFLCNLNAIDFSQDIQDTVKEILTPKISDDWAPESFTVLDTDSFYGPEILVTRGDFCFVAPLPGSLSYRRQQDVQTCH